MHPDTLLSTAFVYARYGERWKNDPTFPKPAGRIKKRARWRWGDLVEKSKESPPPAP
jgi:hypothetical protein